eukprot:3134_1
MNISQDNIKRAYRKMSLLMHPDKAPEQHRKQAEARYKLIQSAFDCLSDPYEKLKYDSQMEFDDSIPDQIQMSKLAAFDIEMDNIASDLENDSDYDENIKLFQNTEMEHRLPVNESKFYELFAPYFIKWKMYSKKSLPPLGNDTSSDEYVRKFYNSWRNFKSWRLFLHEDEIADNIFDLNNAENNKEKKWMMKENQILQAPFKKEESLIIQQMVDNAYIRDPRITRMLYKEREEFLRELLDKKKRKLKKQRERDEKQKLIRQAEEKIRMEKLAIENKKKQAMEQMRMEKQAVPMKLRTLCNNEFFRNENIKGKDIDTICFNASIDMIKSILSVNSEQGQLMRFGEVLLVAKKAKKQKKKAEKLRKKKELEEKEKKAGKPWTDEELNCLVNAVGRFPGGTMNRWEKIQKAVGKQRSVDDIIAKVKDLTKKGRNKKSKKGMVNKKSVKKEVKEEDDDDEEEEDEDVWTKEQQKALENALRAVRTLPANEKWDKLADMVPGKSKKECIERFKWIRSQLQAQKQKK